MNTAKWLLCPLCHRKTRLKIREDMVLENFPLYCPKCHQISLIAVRQYKIVVIQEPSA